MLGREIREIEQMLPGEYEIRQKNGRGVALYYSATHRHALFLRHGVVFATGANLDLMQAESRWHQYAFALHEQTEGSIDPYLSVDLRIPTTRGEWYVQLLNDVVMDRMNVCGMHAALKMVYDQSHDDLGNLRDVRPMKLRAALKVAEEVRREVDDAILAALEIARSVDPEDTEEDWRLGDSCRTPYFLRGSCVNCKRPMDEHLWVQAERARDAERERGICTTPFFLQGKCTTCGKQMADHDGDGAKRVLPV